MEWGSGMGMGMGMGGGNGDRMGNGVGTYRLVVLYTAMGKVGKVLLVGRC